MVFRKRIYLVKDKETGKVIERFRTQGAAKHFIAQHYDRDFIELDWIFEDE